MNRVYYYCFSIIFWLALLYILILSLFVRKKTPVRGVALLPNPPVDWPGGNRTAAFKPLFENAGIDCELYLAWEKKDIEQFLNSKSELVKYSIYFEILRNRIKVFRQLPKYKAVWVQRAFMPIFPFKHAYFEKLAKKFNDNIVYDFYDADYTRNYNLVFETVKYANKVTVASKFLQEKFSMVNPKTSFIRFSINEENYLKKIHGKTGDNIYIGWMGSPENAKELQLIADQLVKIEEDFKNVIFTFVCRDMPNLGLSRATVFSFSDDEFNYYKWINQLDIGMIPYIGQTDRVKAKIAMKSLEFMVSNIPQVVSPWVHSDMLKSNESCIISGPDYWYENLKKLIESSTLRTKLAKEAATVYKEYHNNAKVFESLKMVLFSD